MRFDVTGVPGLRAVHRRTGLALETRNGKVLWTAASVSERVAGSRLAPPARFSARHIPDGVQIAVTPAAVGMSAMLRSAHASGTSLAAAASGPAEVNIGGAWFPGVKVYLEQGNELGDCYLSSAAPTTSYCGQPDNYVGPNDHMLLNYDVADNLPSHAEVLQAFLGMNIVGESTTNPESIGVWESGQAWTNAATWDSYDGTHAWTTAGGDVTGAMQDSAYIGASSDVGTTAWWDVDRSTQGWVDRNPPTSYGVEFAISGTGSNTLEFNNGSTDPYLVIEYEPRMGAYPGSYYTQQKITDRSTLGVNVASGDMQLTSTDLDLPGVNGMDLAVQRTYNNLSTDINSLGLGWDLAPADTQLYVPYDTESTIVYQNGTGQAAIFYQQTPGTWINPPGLDATVSLNGSDLSSSTNISVHFRHSGLTQTFYHVPGQFGTNLYMISETDRNGNKISLNWTYNSTCECDQLSDITDSYGNQTTFGYHFVGADLLIDQVSTTLGTGSGAVTYTYNYSQNSNGTLQSVEDPDGQYTYYGYDSANNLNKITTAGGNITQIAYDAGNTNRVTSVERLVKPSDASGPTWTYSYGAPSGSCPTADGDQQAVVTDPNTHQTTYCTDDQSRIVKIIDANGHTRSTSYQADGFLASTTNGLGATTSYTYEPDSNDNIKTISQTSGSTTLSEGFGGYGSSGIQQFLPTTVTDTQGNQNTYSYDTAGNLQTLQSSVSGSNPAKLTYNSDGTVATSLDPNNEPANNPTTYAYTNHDLTTVTPPTQTTAAGSSVLAPIHLSYDPVNRVQTISTVSGGAGHEVDYSYDAFNRVTQAVYKNAAGSTVATISYSYDADGNLTQLTDPHGTYYYCYDGLERLTAKETRPCSSPGGYIDQYSYDGVGNLKTLTDAGGTVSYTYDPGDRLIQVTDPGASHYTALGYDNDGNLTSITYPSPSAASITRTFNNLDQLTNVTDTYKTSTGTIQTLSYTPSYTSGSKATALVQQLTANLAGAASTTTYSYDQLNRLTNASTTGASPGIIAYGIDGDGNITQVTVNGATPTWYAYNSVNQICWSDAAASQPGNACNSTPAGGHTFTYDTDGNQTSNGNGLTMSYNALAQMTSATNAGNTTTYAYTGEGQDQLLSEGSNALNTDILGLASHQTGASTAYFTRTVAGQQLSQRTSGGTYNYLYDNTGSVVGLVNSSGVLVSQYGYDPYGNQTTTTGTTPAYFSFQDGYLTPSGLIHYGARYLNPGQASWTQEDPFSHIASLTQADRYVFIGDDPVNMVDSSGRDVVASLARTVGKCNAGAVGGAYTGGLGGAFFGPESAVAGAIGGGILGCAYEASGLSSVIDNIFGW